MDSVRKGSVEEGEEVRDKSYPNFVFSFTFLKIIFWGSLVSFFVGCYKCAVANVDANFGGTGPRRKWVTHNEGIEARGVWADRICNRSCSWSCLSRLSHVVFCNIDLPLVGGLAVGLNVVPTSSLRCTGARTQLPSIRAVIVSGDEKR